MRQCFDTSAWCWENSSLLGAWQGVSGRGSHAPVARVVWVWAGSYLSFLWQDFPQEIQSGDACPHPYRGEAVSLPLLSLQGQPLLAPQVTCQEAPLREGASLIVSYKEIITKEAHMHSLAGVSSSHRNCVAVLRWWYSALSHSRHSTMEAWWAVGFQQQLMGSSWGSLALIVDMPVETATTSRNISVLTLGRNLTHALTALTEPPPVVASNHTWTDTTGPLASHWHKNYWWHA